MPLADPGTVLWISGGLGAAVVIVGKVAWDSLIKRVDDNQDLLQLKADADEVKRLWDGQAKILDRLYSHELEDRQRHDQLLEKINDGHAKILERLNEWRTQR